MSRAPLALTLGDPAGVGPELSLKAWRELRDEDVCFVVYGDPAPLMAAAQLLDLPRPELVSDADEARRVFTNFLPVMALEPCESEAASAVRSIEAAVEAVKAGRASAVVTNPVSKSRLYEIGFTFPGHTEFVAHLTADLPMSGARGPVMMLSGGGLRTALVTIHTPLLDAIQSLTPERVAHTVRVVADALKRDFGLAKPRLALAGLNPHAGEGGALGREEIEILAPALEQLRAQGLTIAGPLPPDTMFHEEARAQYDAAICLYHDQGLIPVKTLDFHGGVNITLGLPIIRTSPDHGTAFDIAGKGVARPDSLIAALRQADAMVSSREAEA
ncbi:4-hydroxythreonine-4-phosphate dehydrogenase PdxA [Oceanicaulis sp. LC35]|uniref:4-hydroxythreonine-4-phosphate dehydrogenase PdxA n=1 Tax=Oceanicaulis sp. LC35 TaxID=3349635 RepID=UPI003F85581E